MTFETRWARDAAEEFRRLPATVQTRIAKKLGEAADDPLRFFRRLAGERAWRLRAGDYRVIADIDARARIIRVSAVGHRRNVYDRR